MKTKLRSRTLRFNYATLGVSVAAAIVPAVAHYWPPLTAAAVAFVAACNIVLRHLTTQAIGQEPQPAGDTQDPPQPAA
jgi:hypothetical protein